MIHFEILLNGKILCDASVSDEDQLETALVKLTGHDKPVLNVTVFSPSKKYLRKYSSWQSKVVGIGDEVTIKINEIEDELDSYLDGADEDQREKKELESNIFCSFCGKGNLEVDQMIAGETAFICNECIDFCSDTVNES